MRSKVKILFLGSPDSPLVSWLKDMGEIVKSYDNEISIDMVKNHGFDFLISYGYRFILRKSILSLFPNAAINLHISFLPFNRGADPNFWSFIERTTKGVSIHMLDEGVDTGDIIFQKKVFFKDIEDLTLNSSYDTLQLEIQNLFYANWNKIKNHNYNRTPQNINSGSYHRLNDKCELFSTLCKDGWNTKVYKLKVQR